MLSDPRVEIVSKALHTFHGRGYCSMGKHERHMNFHCYDEARAILTALDGADPGEIPQVKPALTLSARQQRTRTTTRRKTK